MYPTDVPWRLRQAWCLHGPPLDRLRAHPRHLETNSCRSFPGTLHARCSTKVFRLAAASQYDCFIIQETGWSLSGERSNQRWHFVHSSDKQASVLIMVRTNVVSRHCLSTAVHIPGRCVQARLPLHRPYDLLAIYQHSWNPGRGTQVWKKLQDCVNHIPVNHSFTRSNNAHHSCRPTTQRTIELARLISRPSNR